MTRSANSCRGETSLVVGGKCHMLRPSFEALVAAEDELGSLFGLIDRAAEGALSLKEIAELLWHCLPPDDRPDRGAVGDAVLEMGLLEASKPMRAILAQILKGSA